VALLRQLHIPYPLSFKHCSRNNVDDQAMFGDQKPSLFFRSHWICTFHMNKGCGWPKWTGSVRTHCVAVWIGIAIHVRSLCYTVSEEWWGISMTTVWVGDVSVYSNTAIIWLIQFMVFLGNVFMLLESIIIFHQWVYESETDLNEVIGWIVRDGEQIIELFWLKSLKGWMSRFKWKVFEYFVNIIN